MAQKKLKERLKYFLLTTGTKQRYICSLINLPEPVLSKFVHDKKKLLYPEHETLLDQFLKSRSF